MTDRVQAPLNEGAGYYIPPRDPAHSDPQWFEKGTDEDFNDPDLAPLEVLLTPRHKAIPR